MGPPLEHGGMDHDAVRFALRINRFNGAAA